MADMTPLRSIDNGTAADAIDVDFNFDTVQSYVNTALIKKDGTIAMAAALNAGGFKVTNLAAATAVSDVPRFDQVGISDHESLGSAVTIPASGSATIDTISVTVPAAGAALLVLVGGLDYVGTNTVGLGDSDAVTIAVTGGTFAVPLIGRNGGSNDRDPFTFFPAGTGTIDDAHQITIVGLASGANTLTITGSRTASGGTVEVNAGTRAFLLGAF